MKVNGTVTEETVPVDDEIDNLLKKQNARILALEADLVELLGTHYKLYRANHRIVELEAALQEPEDMGVLQRIEVPLTAEGIKGIDAKLEAGFHLSVLEFLADPVRLPDAEATNEACKWALLKIAAMQEAKK